MGSYPGKFISASEIGTEGPYLCYGGNGVRGRVSKFNRKGRFPLIGRQGALCGNINIAQGEFYATEHAVVADSQGLMDVDCAAYFLRSLNLNQYATKTAQPGLSVKRISKTPFPVPPISEQRRIVARLKELLPLVEEFGKHQSALEKLEKEFPSKLKASILQQAIEGNLVPQLDSEPAVEQIGKVPEEVPFEIPEKWKWERFGTLIDVISGTSYKKTDEVPAGNGVRIIRGGNIKDFKVSFFADDVFVNESLRDEQKVVRPTDVVVVASTGSKTVIGNPGMCACSNGAQIGAFLRILRPYDEDFSDFIKIFVQSDYYRKNIRDQAKGTNINNIKRGYLEKMAFPLPPLAEQRRIVARIKELFEQIDNFTKSWEVR